MTNHYCPNVHSTDTRRLLTLIMLGPLKAIIDLSFVRPESQPSAALREEAVREFWQNDFLSTDGLSSCARFSSLRRLSQGNLQIEAVLLLGSVPVYGICATDLSRKPARYRSLFAPPDRSSITWGFVASVSRNTFGECESVRDWQHLCRFRTSADPHRSRTPSQRQLRRRIQGNCLCARCNDHRFVSVIVPVGDISQAQGCSETAYAFDLRGNIPSIIVITHGKVHDVNILDQLVFEAGATYVMDRGYLDFKRLYKITRASAFFVTRAKSTSFSSVSIHCRSTNPQACSAIRSYFEQLLSQQMVSGQASSHSFSRCKKQQAARLIDQQLLSLSPVIADLYRCRWQVELFFKWIKQHLRIKAFYGTTQNALKTQIWIAISVYVLVAIVKKG